MSAVKASERLIMRSPACLRARSGKFPAAMSMKAERAIRATPNILISQRIVWFVSVPRLSSLRKVSGRATRVMLLNRKTEAPVLSTIVMRLANMTGD